MAVSVALAVVQLASPSSAMPPGRLGVPGPLGTVDTVAGPAFCAGPARPDPASAAVGGLATDVAGTLWFESGRIGEAVLTKVISSAAVSVVRAGLNRTDTTSEDEGTPRPSLASASRVAADGAGGVLFATPTGILQLAVGVVTVTGTTAGPEVAPEEASGDGGPLRAARFRRIVAMTTDRAGNVYVADEIKGAEASIAIRFLNRSAQPVTFYPRTSEELTVAPGAIDTIAGRVATDQPDRGVRLVAEAPVLAVAADRLYVGAILADPRPRAQVQVVNLGGGELSAHGVTVAPARAATVATVPGPPRTAGPAGWPSVSALPGIAVDGEGNLFLAERANHRVRRVDQMGRTTTLAGTGSPGIDGPDRPATQSRLNQPYDVEAGPDGRVYISDVGNSQVRFVDQGGKIRPALGNGTTTRWACVAGDAPQPAHPVRLAADPRGNLYLNASHLGQVHRLAPSGSLRPLAGRAPDSCREPTGCPFAEDAPPTDAELSVSDVAVAPAGGLYLLESSRARLLNTTDRAVTAHGVVVPTSGMRTIWGSSPSATAPSTPNAPDWNARTTGIRFATAVAGDADGNLFIGDVPERLPGSVETGSVRQVDTAGAVTTLVAPPLSTPMGAVSDCCAAPADIVVDGANNLYILDGYSRRVWFLNRSPAAVVVHGVPVAPGALEPIVGKATAGSQDEGIAGLEAMLSGPSAIALDGAGNLYLSDTDESTVHRVDASGTITTVIGTGQPGFNGDGLKGALTALSLPVGVAVDACGNLLVADQGNDRVRRLNLVRSCRAMAATPIDTSRSVGSIALRSAAMALLGGVAAGCYVRRRRGARSRRNSVVGNAAGTTPRADSW